MEVTRNEKLRLQSKRFPYRYVLRVVPLPVVKEIVFESRLAWLRMTRPGIDPRFAGAKDLLVNVGCGSSGLDGWVNIDCFPAEPVTCVRDSSDFSSSAVRLCSWHLHRALSRAPRLLRGGSTISSRNAGVCCEPGGLLRVIVPDGAKYLRSVRHRGLAVDAIRSVRW